MPPRSDDSVFANHSPVRNLKRQCRIEDDGLVVEGLVSRVVDELWPGSDGMTTAHPIQRFHLNAAKRFLRPLCVQHFDNNASSLGVFCPRLVWEATRTSLESSTPAEERVYFERLLPALLESVLTRLCFIPRINLNLFPPSQRHPPVVTGACLPAILPNCISPAAEWRLLIRRSRRRIPAPSGFRLLDRCVFCARCT